MKEQKNEFTVIETGIFITSDEYVKLSTSTLDPNASKFGPRTRKEPYEVLQDIARRRGLPELGDMYGLTESGQIVCRNLSKNREALKNLTNKNTPEK